MQDFIVWMQGTWLAQFMAESEYAWGWTEVLHFIGMSMLFGSVLIMDARLMGFFRTTISIRAVQALARLAAAGFAINLLTGIVFLVKDAHRLLPNPAFQLKMVFVLVAGLNFILFMVLFGKKSVSWRDDENPPVLAKLIAVVSVTAWVLVIWSGRMIPVYGEG
jgi:hypothetical protein